MSNSDILTFLDENPGWHDLEAISEGTGLGMTTCARHCRRLYRNHYMEARMVRYKKEYRGAT